MRPITVTVGPLVAAAANNIALSQTPTAAFTLNGSLVTGGVVILDTPRRVIITTTADESAKTITFVGTDASGFTQTELMTGPNTGVGQTNLDFKTITSITTSAVLAAVTVGTNGVASSAWVRLDNWANPVTTIQCVVTGTVSYSVQSTMQDPNSPTDPIAPYLVTWTDSPDPNVVAATDTEQSYYQFSPLWARVLLNSGTGSVSTVFSQLSSVPF